MVSTGQITEYDILNEINEIRKVSYIPVAQTPCEVCIPIKQSPQNHFYLLSKDAQKAVYYILDMLDPVAVKNEIHNNLCKRFGWKDWKTKRIIKEIKEYLKYVDSADLMR
jgi:hypothetical protein